MSVFGEAIIDRLHTNCALRDRDNSMRHILDNGLGRWLDEFEEDSLSENIFLESATGKWLDIHGAEYNVLRKVDESDEDYHNRIIYEAIGHLTVDYLKDVYGVDLYAYVDRFDVKDNTLTSENPFVSEKFIGEASTDASIALNKKFILDNAVSFLSFGGIDYIIDDNDDDLLPQYKGTIYNLTNLRYFSNMENIVKVHLSLPSATNCSNMLRNCYALTNVTLNLPSATNCSNMLSGCYVLTNVTLNLPSATNCQNMLRNCSVLTNVTLNLPTLDYYNYMFTDCSELEYINLTIPSSKVSPMKSYIQSLNLQYLTTLIINGEEVEL